MQTKNTRFRLSILIATVLLSACTMHAQIDVPPSRVQSFNRQTNELAEVKADALATAQQVGKENVLVVFDIDNTLMAMEQGLGSDQWYEWQKELNDDDLCNPDNVGNRFAVQGALYFISAMRSTQEDGPQQVRAIQDAGIPVISVTARGMDYQLQTFRELRRNGYSFSHTPIGNGGDIEMPFIPVKGGRLSLYHDGVFLTAGQHKGQMLQVLLAQTGTKTPAVIIMVDDKQKNLDAVKETFSSLDVTVHAWRYSGEDNNVRQFDSNQAAAQWRQLEGPLKQIQKIVGPDNYDLGTAGPPAECH